MRHEQVLGIAAFVLREPHPLHRRAEVLFARNAVVAESVAPSTVDRDMVSFFHGMDTRTNASDRTGILMAKRERHSRKDLDVARNDVEIAVTETSALDSNHDLPWTRRRSGHVVNDERLPVCVKSCGLHDDVSLARRWLADIRPY